MFKIKDILDVASKLNVNFDKFSLTDFITGINIELKHCLVDSVTNATDSDLLKDVKIALVHLNEIPDYYNKDYGLPALENYLKQKNR